jgi:hypothetical protein
MKQGTFNFIIFYCIKDGIFQLVLIVIMFWAAQDLNKNNLKMAQHNIRTIFHKVIKHASIHLQKLIMVDDYMAVVVVVVVVKTTSSIPVHGFELSRVH